MLRPQQKAQSSLFDLIEAFDFEFEDSREALSLPIAPDLWKPVRRAFTILLLCTAL